MTSIPDPVMNGLTAARTALEARSDRWLHVMVVATVLVAIGVAIEVWATILEVRDERRKGGKIEWHHILTFVGAILVAAFVGLECVAEYKGGDIETKLREQNSQIEQVLTNEASDAKDSSIKAASAATVAKEQSDKAVASASVAFTSATGARKEADSFQKDIASAKTLATDAESHLADAMKRANALTAQLDRITTSRSLSDSPQLVSSLKQFKGTEYMFTGVCGDMECISLLRDIEKVLGLAEWKRVKAPHTFPGLLLWGKREDDDGVGFDFEPGTTVSVDSVQGAEELEKLPLASLPQQVQAAVALNLALASNVSPTENTGRLVDVQTGTSSAVRISVGRKPLP